MLTPKHKALLKSLTIPVVVLGQKTDLASCIYHDDYHAAYDLTKYLIEKGRTHIGYIGVTLKDIAVGTDRRNGFLDCMKDHNLPVSEEQLAIGAFDMENGYDNARLIRRKKPETDALLCATDTIAIGAMKYLHECENSGRNRCVRLRKRKNSRRRDPIPDNDPLLLPDQRYRRCKNAA